MSDMRFILGGVAAVFAGFIVLSAFGSAFFAGTIESREFDECYVYSSDEEPVPVDCAELESGKALFAIIVIVIIGSGSLMLVKGAKGSWDQDTAPQDASPSR